MKKYISYSLILILSLSLLGCAKPIHYHDKAPKDELAFLETISENDDQIKIFKINGEKTENSWRGGAADYYVKYGKITIGIKYRNDSEYATASTSLTFSTLPNKTYKISSDLDIDSDNVTIKVTQDSNLLTEKTVELRYQSTPDPAIPVYIPVIIY
ncbi:MAG: hypothetical protein JXQ67_01025 [Campylobacterales bacterium]|nr:hypothetical protein [Campylobacterales bacterium]